MKKFLLQIILILAIGLSYADNSSVISANYALSSGENVEGSMQNMDQNICSSAKVLDLGVWVKYEAVC